MNVSVDESETSMALLNGLPEDYAPLITAMDTMSGENEVLKFDYVKSRVMQEEQRITIRTSQANAKIRSNCISYNPYFLVHLVQRVDFAKRKGHNEAACWKKNPHLNPHKKQNPTAFVADRSTSDDPTIVCLVAKHSCYTAQTKQSDSQDWIIDSGCSNHMTYDKSIFQSYTTISGQFVGVGGGNKLPIIGTGNVRIQIIVEGTQRTCMLMGAYHVPELGYSLVSVPSLDKRKLYTQFGDQRCMIKNHSEVLLATGTIQGNVYKLDFDSSRQVHSQALIASDISIWHKRLAHIDPASVAKMHKDGCVLGARNITLLMSHRTMCDDCVIGKGPPTAVS